MVTLVTVVVIEWLVVKWVTWLVGCGWWVVFFFFLKGGGWWCGFARLRVRGLSLFVGFSSEKIEKEMKRQEEI